MRISNTCEQLKNSSTEHMKQLATAALRWLVIAATPHRIPPERKWHAGVKQLLATPSDKQQMQARCTA
ncbi:hypothetical protein [Paenibacillus xerothermodurans]|uniref:Uncharacterized protein n=1 Tax=Paenibacillus xerothermodurans TaxID=1977292 RepID=A0A2W1N6K4_PAEXE|nr:hypothetical protein [Paenibacillus xerothermodurans]PZE19424.1 hypothetical protein CBW46_018865 [Paenibacillus xerothermodurans]